jgi:hypothetical protein
MNEMSQAIYAPNIPAITEDFDTVAVRVGRVLTDAEVSQVSGCLGYALRVEIAGEDLSDPVMIVRTYGETYLTYWYDSTKGARSSRDGQAALELAAQLIVEGSPLRKSNRSGPNTIGTRLVQGIGPVALTFYVDVPVDAPEPTPPAAAALAALNAAVATLNAAQHAYAQAAIQYAKVGA